MKVAALFAAFAVSAHAFAPSSSFTNSVSLSAAPRAGSYLQMNSAERTYIMIKPDGVQRGIVGNIISRFETKGYKLVAMKTKQASKELLETHYVDLVEKPFFPGLRDYMMSGPVCCMVWEGKEAVATGRKMLGATNPLASEPGTIRGDSASKSGATFATGQTQLRMPTRRLRCGLMRASLLTGNLTQKIGFTSKHKATM